MDQPTIIAIPSTSPVDYYQLLETSRDADQDALKKAYRKTALKYHPDKIGKDDPEAVTRFQNIQKAYETLSDPKKRKIYDQYGEKGIQMMESMGTYAPFIDPDMILAINWFLFLGSLIVALAIILASFLSVRIDGLISWPWLIVFSPLWIIDVFILYQIIGFPVSPPESADAETADRVQQSRMLKAIKALLFVIFGLFSLFQIFIALRLDNYIDWTWIQVATPWLVLEGFYFIRLLVVTVSQMREAVYTEESGEQGPRRVTILEGVGIIARNFSGQILRLAQGLLILYKVDGLNASWPVVFIPTWSWGFIELFKVIASWYTIRSMSISDPRAAERKTLIVGQIIMFVLSTILVYTGFGLLVKRLQSGEPVPTTAVILIPVFILLSISFCCFCCVLPMTVMGAQAGLEEELGKGKGGPGEVVPLNRRIADTST